MELITKIALNCNYNYTKTRLLLRLCKKSYYKSTINYTYNRCETNAVNENKKIDIKDIFSPEHEIIHSILKNSEHYKNTIFPRIKVIPLITIEEITHLYTTYWPNESAEDILKALQKLAYCYLNESPLELSYCMDILNSCREKLETLNDYQILKLMQSLIVLRETLKTEKDYQIFIKKLNKECLKRFYTSDSKQLLLWSDAFYQLHNATSDYMWRALRKLVIKPHRLSAKSVVQLLFLITVPSVKIPINMFEIESRLIDCVNELSANEIGIIARGFFLYKKKIRNKDLISAMIQVVIKYSSSIDSSTLASIMKIIRYSDGNHNVAILLNLVEVLRKEVPRLNLQCLTSIAHASAALRVYDEILMNNILESLEETLHSSRVKDIERILLHVCLLAPETQYYVEICYKIMNHIVSTYTTYKTPEIHIYPSSLIRTLSFLTIKNVYIPELIQFIFDPSFMQKNSIYTSMLTLESLILHCSIKIDLPNYEGPLLSENMYRFLTKKYSHDDEDIYRKDNHMKLKCEIMYICKNNLGLNAHVDYILPHYISRDIVLGFDKYNNSVNIEPILSAMPTNSIKRVDSVELKTINWIVLLILMKTLKMHGRDGYIGTIHRKLRHLKTIGYTPIPICQHIWQQCPDEKKVKYLESLIYQRTSMFPNGVP